MPQLALQRPAAAGRLAKLMCIAAAPILMAGCVPEGPIEPGAEASLFQPQAAITTPGDGSRFLNGEKVRFIGRATDHEDRELEEDALLWTSSLDGELGKGSEFETEELSIGDHLVTLTATDPEGHVGTDSVAISVENNPPTAEIRDPDDGDIFRRNREIKFKGRGEDVEDGRLEDDALVWMSSVDGVLGTGEEVKTKDLSPGTHAITLTVTDSHGDSGTDEIEVVVLPF